MYISEKDKNKRSKMREKRKKLAVVGEEAKYVRLSYSVDDKVGKFDSIKKN